MRNTQRTSLEASLLRGAERSDTKLRFSEMEYVHVPLLNQIPFERYYPLAGSSGMPSSINT